MSTHNPLNEYNSYSYHHFLVIADTTERANEIADSPEDFFQFVRTGVNKEGLSILVNPMSSNKLIIQDISWTTIMNADDAASTGANAANSHVEGKMTILEPLGVRFFNKIYDIYRGFGVSSGGMSAVWVLKTVFVGYRDAPYDGEAEYISNLKPMPIFPLQFSAEFTEAGGRYEIEFVAANSGAGGARVNNSTAVTVGGSFNLGGEKATTETVTLATAMKNFETRMEELYEKNYAKIAEMQAKSPNKALAEHPPEKVQYRINLDKKLQDSTFVVETTPELSAGGNGKVPILKVMPNDRLDQSIQRIWMLSPQVMALATKGDAAGKRWLPIVLSTTETLDPAQNNGVRVRNVYNVILREIVTQYNPDSGPQSTTEVKTAQGTTTQVVDGTDVNGSSPEATAVKQEAIATDSFFEYDYTYTGKNVDVLQYDMRMNMGTGFFQSIISPSTVPSTGQIPATGVNAHAATPPLGAGTGSVAVNPAVAANGAAVHAPTPQAVSSYQEIYRRWVQTESIRVTMKIRGNPLLMDGLNLSAADIQQALNGGGKTGPAGSWLNGPLVVKVNVRMPVEDEPNVYEPFWYDGFYRILTVQTSFASGDFTQDIEMIAITDHSMPFEEDSTERRPKGPGPSSEDMNAFLGDPEPTGDRVPVGTLKISERGIEWIKKFESFAARKYPDNGRYAIGYGHNLTDAEQSSGIIQLSNSRVIVDAGITKEQADELMRRDVRKIAENAIHNKISVNLYQHEYDILCSMCYNLGSGLILGPDSTLLKKLNRQLYTQIPEEIRKWNKWRRNGQLVENPGLVQRRDQEAKYWGSFA